MYCIHYGEVEGGGAVCLYVYMNVLRITSLARHNTRYILLAYSDAATTTTVVVVVVAAITIAFSVVVVPASAFSNPNIFAKQPNTGI